MGWDWGAGEPGQAEVAQRQREKERKQDVRGGAWQEEQWWKESMEAAFAQSKLLPLLPLNFIFNNSSLLFLFLKRTLVQDFVTILLWENNWNWPQVWYSEFMASLDIVGYHIFICLLSVYHDCWSFRLCDYHYHHSTFFLLPMYHLSMTYHLSIYVADSVYLSLFWLFLLSLPLNLSYRLSLPFLHVFKSLGSLPSAETSQ